MKMIFPAVLAMTLMAPNLHAAQKHEPAPRYAVAVSATPVLNTPDFKKMFDGSIKLDPCQGVRPIEFVALPGTLFTVVEELDRDGVRLYRVTTGDYPYPKTELFVDARFVRQTEFAKERPRVLPEVVQIQKRLLAALGKPYVWGGNVKDGVPLLKSLYPAGDPLAGVDCSGLLYEATDGFTPRNTSALVSFGEAVPVSGLTPREIAKKLKPLDLLVWDGHVMVVLDGDSIIESKMGCNGKSGVLLTPIGEGLEALMKQREPVDEFPQGAAGAKSFAVRRWL